MAAFAAHFWNFAEKSDFLSASEAFLVLDIETLRQMYHDDCIKWSQHCMERMGERDISISDFEQCLDFGEIIEDYPNDYPYPSCLILGHLKDGRMLHAVVGSNGQWIYIITVYIPSPEKFESDGKTRREK